MPRASKAVAKKAQPKAPALANQFEEFADQGYEEADRDAFAIPFLSILQSGSPQCKKSEGEYIEGAQEGMFFNTVSNEVVDPEKVPCYLIPCHYSRAFVEWQPRETGGGFVAQHSVEVAARWDADNVVVEITDDGPGFPASVLSAIGEPFISTRADDGEHMGLGIFIAQTLLDRVGATLTFANRDGAEVVIRWPRFILDQGNGPTAQNI